jgi:hypothetical protein
MASILQLAQNMGEELHGLDQTLTHGPTPPIPAFVTVGRGQYGGCDQSGRGGRGGRGLPNKCSAFGGMDHILSPFTASDDTLLK